MKVNDIAAKELVSELTKSKVVVSFSNKLIQEVVNIKGGSDLNADHQQIDSENIVDLKLLNIAFRPFSITINDRFTSTLDYYNLIDEKSVDSDYELYIEELRNKVINEIEENINLRINKWEILSYLSNLESELKEIRNNFEIPDVVVENEQGTRLIKHDEQFKIGKFPIYENLNIKIQNKYVENDPDLSHSEFLYRDELLSRYWDLQICIIERIIRFIEPREKVIEITDDYVKVINILPGHSSLRWNRSDTDMLELVIALLESGAIQNSTKDLTQKEAIQIFSDFFN